MDFISGMESIVGKDYFGQVLITRTKQGNICVRNLMKHRMNY